jgi:hypothetical protein
MIADYEEIGEGLKRSLLRSLSVGYVISCVALH